jgi:DNA-binding CsgD family transcriptional regulator
MPFALGMEGNMSIDKQNDDQAIRVHPQLRSEYFSELVKSVLRRMESGITDVPEHGGAADSQQVLFDIDLDGSRYLLIKAVHKEARKCALSPRQREIVRRVALGHQNKVIAAAFGISTWTVSTHLRRIFTKLGVSSRAAMVAKAAALGESSERRPAPWA